MPNSTNEVIVNGRVVMSVRGDTVTENTLVQGETAHDKTGKEIVGNLNPQSSEELNELRERVDALDEEAYRVLDRVEEIEEEDYIPFNDSDDEEHPKKKTLFSSIIDKLKSIFAQKSELKTHTFEMGTEIPANSDLNTFTSIGVYQCEFSSTARTMTNLPYTGNDRYAFKLIVMADRKNSNLVQWYIPYTNNDTDTGTKLAWRTTDDGGTTWNAWSYVARISDISPSTVGDGYASATVSGSVITATISGFQLRAGVIVTLKCQFDFPASAVLNINNTGAKQIVWWLDNGIRTVDNQSLNGMTITFMYDGTYYRIISVANTPRLLPQNYVANTSGNIVVASGYDQNAFQIKYSVEFDKLLWNYYKNSAWRGDVKIADYDDIKHQTVGITIPDNANLNDYTTNGIYNVGSNNKALTITNIPCGRAGKLVVERIAGSTYIVQTYYTYKAEYTQFNGVYRRSYDNGAWTTWLHDGLIYKDSSGNRTLVLIGDTTTANDNFVGIRARIQDITTNGTYENNIVRVYHDHQANPAGLSMVLGGGGNTFIGGGEAGVNHYNVYPTKTDENLFLTSDGDIILQANANTIANRLGFRLDANGNLLPCKADAKVDNQGNIGWSDKKLAGIWTYKLNGTDVVDGDTNKFQLVGGLGIKQITIPDNGGNLKFLKMCDVTTWYNSTTTGQESRSFVGYIISSREGNGYIAPNRIAKVDMGVSYEKATSVNVNTLRLFTDQDLFRPVILKEVLNGVTKYYLALRVGGSGRHALLVGRFRMNDIYASDFINEWVNYNGSSLPTGYTIEVEGKLFREYTCYATCTTAGDQQIKVATIDDPSWKLTNGTIVGVKFTNTNTYSATSDNKIQLNVNGTGAKPIYYNTGYPTGTNTAVFGYANRVQFYMYDGTNWVWISAGVDIDSNNRKSFYGTCTTAGDQQIKVVTISDTNGWELRAGTIVGVKFTNSNTYSATSDNKIQLNVNNSGAKNIYYNTGYPTGTSQYVCGYANRTQYYMYNGTDWVWISAGVEVDTVDPRALGSGYGICETAEATTAKVATLASYTLRTGGIVSVRFAYNVPANSTLNINSRGAKPIYQRTWAIPADVIKTGDIATFVYDGSHYVLLGTDRTERQFANYRYANSAGTPDTTYLTRNDTSVLFTELSYIKRGDTVMFGCVVRFASSKTYSAGTKIATLAYSSLQICYPHASFYISGNGLYIRNGTYNGYYYLQCTYIGI